MTHAALPNPLHAFKRTFVARTVSGLSFNPMARVFSFAKQQVTGSHSFVGSASIDGVIVDGTNNDILVAFVDHRSGDKGLGGGSDALEDAREAFQWWGARLRTVLDEARDNRP